MRYYQAEIGGELYRLSDGRADLAVVDVVRRGQQPPDEGDGVVCEAWVGLGANDYGLLDPHLRFGKRVEVLGEPLHKNWGSSKECIVGTYRASVVPGYRYSVTSAVAATWEEAEAAAIAKAEEQINKLLDACRERLKALQEAGE